MIGPPRAPRVRWPMPKRPEASASASLVDSHGRSIAPTFANVTGAPSWTISNSGCGLLPYAICRVEAPRSSAFCRHSMSPWKGRGLSVLAPLSAPLILARNIVGWAEMSSPKRSVAARAHSRVGDAGIQSRLSQSCASRSAASRPAAVSSSINVVAARSSFTSRPLQCTARISLKVAN